MATKSQVLSAVRKLEQKHGITIEVATRRANTLSDMYEIELFIADSDWHFCANESGFVYGQGYTLSEAYNEALIDLRRGVEKKIVATA